MKKLTLFLVAAVCLCSGNANAQDGKGSINFVPYVGINNSNFSGDADQYFGETSGKLNLMAGFSFEFQILEKSAIIADVNYRRLGATTGNAIRWDSASRFPIGENGIFSIVGNLHVGESYPSGEAYGNYNRDEIFRQVMESDAGYEHGTKSGWRLPDMLWCCRHLNGLQDYHTQFSLLCNLSHGQWSSS